MIASTLNASSEIFQISGTAGNVIFPAYSSIYPLFQPEVPRLSYRPAIYPKIVNVKNKLLFIPDLIREEETDLAYITVSWLGEEPLLHIKPSIGLSAIFLRVTKTPLDVLHAHRTIITIDRSISLSICLKIDSYQEAVTMGFELYVGGEGF